MIVAGLMALLGGLWLLNKYKVLRIQFLDFGPPEYRIRPPIEDEVEPSG
jgi:hypothetical protein